MAPRTVYVASWPKSGSTWLAWLLGDALNCPVGAWRADKDIGEFATEGRDRPGPFVVRRGHFRLVDDAGQGEPARSLTKLAWRALTDEAVVYIVRDPRDIAVSSAHYWARPVGYHVEWMCGGDPTEAGWADTVEAWLDASFQFAMTSYEQLTYDCPFTVWTILKWIGLPTPTLDLLEAVCKRQSLATRRRSQAARPGGRYIPEHFFWQGGVGKWRHYLDRATGRALEDCCGETMRRLGYESDPDWWKELPEHAPRPM